MYSQVCMIYMNTYTKSTPLQVLIILIPVFHTYLSDPSWSQSTIVSTNKLHKMNMLNLHVGAPEFSSQKPLCHSGVDAST